MRRNNRDITAAALIVLAAIIGTAIVLMVLKVRQDNHNRAVNEQNIRYGQCVLNSTDPYSSRQSICAARYPERR